MPQDTNSMGKDFSREVYCGFILKGDLHGAMAYVGECPDQAELFGRYAAVFEREEYPDYGLDGELNGILRLYQRYYRDVFYLQTGRQTAMERLRDGLAELLGVDAGLEELEERELPERFQAQGLHFLGGRTGGYYGPYVWRTVEERTYAVELPDGIQPYTVRLLDGFLSRGWMDGLSFGVLGPGGWTDGDGIINCVRASYDLDSENFRVSLLKHEAQHARDLAVDRDMASEDLEYRAKLVELIYSEERNLLARFALEADDSDAYNGHGLAARRIVERFAGRLGIDAGKFGAVPMETIQRTALELFRMEGK